jgi:alkylation response protein AidB-like acyl-CoA dehydrogenase
MRVLEDLTVEAAWVAAEARHQADVAERERTMPEPLVASARRAGLFRMAMPAALGGLELEPLSIVRAVQEVSRGDGSAGWSVLIGNSTAFFAWLDPTAASEMLGGAVDVVSSSMFAPLGTAHRDGDDLVVHGRWPFNSGCLHADWLQAGVIVMDGDRPAQRPDGRVDARFAFFPRSGAEILDTWWSMGLRGTGSHDIEVHGLRVPERQTAAPMQDPPVLDGALCRLGFFPLLSVLMSGFPLGVARRALDEIETLAPTKRRGASRTTIAEDSHAQHEVGRAEAALQSAECFVVDAVGAAWDAVSAGGPLGDAQAGRVALAAEHAMSAAVQVVDVALGLAGAGAVYAGHPLERCFRDLHTANQHIAFSGEGHRSYARARFGLT